MCGSIYRLFVGFTYDLIYEIILIAAGVIDIFGRSDRIRPEFWIVENKRLYSIYILDIKLYYYREIFFLLFLSRLPHISFQEIL